VDLSSTQGALCTVHYQYFFILHFTYLGGCVRTPPLPTGGPGHGIACITCATPPAVVEALLIAIVLSFSRRASTLTIEYSMNAPNTNTRHVAIQTSIACTQYIAGFQRVEALGMILIRGPYPPSDAIIYIHFYE